MHSPAKFHGTEKNSRVAGSETHKAACSAGAVFWEMGLVLAVFLGLVLTISATLTASGVN
jgi:hypothetical protein